MTAYNNNVVKPCKLYYKDREFTIGSLGLTNICEAALYRFAKRYRPNCDMTGITYRAIYACEGIGIKQAREISEALINQGVEIDDIPEATKPMLILNWKGIVECTSCHTELADCSILSVQIFKYCPMCGKRLKW